MADPTTPPDNGDLFDEKNVIFRYTIDQAVEDGILCKLSSINPDWERGYFSHVTWNLLRQGYTEPIDAQHPEKGDKIRVVNLVDLLNQCNQVLIPDARQGKLDWFYSPKIEFPDGHRRDVFIQLNEIQRYTIMDPSDY